MVYQSPFFWGVLTVLGLVAGYFIRQLIAAKQLNSVEQKIRRQIEEAKTKAKEIVLEAQEKSTSLLEEVKKEERERKIQIDRSEERLLKKEEAFEKQAVDLKSQNEHIDQEIEKLKTAKAKIDELKQKIETEMEKIAGLTAVEAKEKLLKDIQEKYRDELIQTFQKLEKKKKRGLLEFVRFGRGQKIMKKFLRNSDSETRPFMSGQKSAGCWTLISQRKSFCGT